MKCPDCGTVMENKDDPKNARLFMEGEEWVCPKCGYYTFLDYDEMR